MKTSGEQSQPHVSTRSSLSGHAARKELDQSEPSLTFYHVTHCLDDLSFEHRWGLIDNHHDFFWYLDTPSNLLEFSTSGDAQSRFLSK